MVKPDDEQPDFTQFEVKEPGGTEPAEGTVGEPEALDQPMFTEADGAAPAAEASAEGPSPGEGLAGLDFAAVDQPIEPSDGVPGIALEEKKAAEEKPEEEEPKETKPSFLARLAEASPYTVMLGISLGALVIAVLCLLLELKSYDFDISAKSARGRVALPRVYSAERTTTAAAWPAQVKLSDTAARC